MDATRFDLSPGRFPTTNAYALAKSITDLGRADHIVVRPIIYGNKDVKAWQVA